jgi:hypothetical protein
MEAVNPSTGNEYIDSLMAKKSQDAFEKLREALQIIWGQKADRLKEISHILYDSLKVYIRINNRNEYKNAVIDFKQVNDDAKRIADYCNEICKNVFSGTMLWILIRNDQEMKEKWIVNTRWIGKSAYELKLHLLWKVLTHIKYLMQYSENLEQDILSLFTYNETKKNNSEEQDSKEFFTKELTYNETKKKNSEEKYLKEFFTKELTYNKTKDEELKIVAGFLKFLKENGLYLKFWSLWDINEKYNKTNLGIVCCDLYTLKLTLIVERFFYYIPREQQYLFSRIDTDLTKTDKIDLNFYTFMAHFDIVENDACLKPNQEDKEFCTFDEYLKQNQEDKEFCTFDAHLKQNEEDQKFCTFFITACKDIGLFYKDKGLFYKDKGLFDKNKGLFDKKIGFFNYILLFDEMQRVTFERDIA